MFHIEMTLKNGTLMVTTAESENSHRNYSERIPTSDGPNG
jgi:hypothetical protein